MKLLNADKTEWNPNDVKSDEIPAYIYDNEGNIYDYDEYESKS